MEIQAGSHNGDPSRFTQWKSKPVHTMEIQISSQELSGNPFQITWPFSFLELYFQRKAYVLAEWAFFVVHFFFEVPAFMAAALELDQVLDDEDVLELESEAGALEAPEQLSTFSSSEFEGSDLLRGS